MQYLWKRSHPVAAQKPCGQSHRLLNNDTSLTDGAFVAQTGSICRQIRPQKQLHKIVQFRLDLPENFTLRHIPSLTEADSD
jgi:hypothetical protein